MVRIAAINYLNTIPFIYGLETRMAPSEIVLDCCIPSATAARLKDGRCDVGLVPVGALSELDNPQIIADYCIGTGRQRTSLLRKAAGAGGRDPARYRQPDLRPADAVSLRGEMAYQPPSHVL